MPSYADRPPVPPRMQATVDRWLAARRLTDRPAEWPPGSRVGVLRERGQESERVLAGHRCEAVERRVDLRQPDHEAAQRELELGDGGGALAHRARLGAVDVLPRH